MLGDLEDEALALVRRLQSVQNLGQFAIELHVDDGADHLRDAASGIGACFHSLVLSTAFVRALRRPR